MMETKLPSSVLKLRELQRQNALKTERTKNVLTTVLAKLFSEGRVFTEQQLIEIMNRSGADPLHSPWAVRQAWNRGDFIKHPVTGVITERKTDGMP